MLEQKFDSFEAFLEQAAKPGNTKNPTHSISNSPSFCGTDTYEEALELAQKGWPEGLRRMEALRGQLIKINGDKVEVFAPQFAESGDEVDVARFLSGEPECMVQFEPQFVPGVGRVIRIVVNIAVSGGNSHEQMFLKGAATVMLCDLIEQAGLRVEIVIIDATKSHPVDGELSIRSILAKKPDQPLELDRLAFACAHPAMQRRIIFRLQEQVTPEDFAMHFPNCNYGMPADIQVGEGEIYIGALQHSFGKQINTEADCIAFVNSTIAQYVEPQPA